MKLVRAWTRHSSKMTEKDWKKYPYPTSDRPKTVGWYVKTANGYWLGPFEAESVARELAHVRI